MGSNELAWAVHGDGHGRHGQRHVDGEAAQREGLHDQAAQALWKLRGGRHARGRCAGRDTCTARGLNGKQSDVSVRPASTAVYEVTSSVLTASNNNSMHVRGGVIKDAGPKQTCSCCMLFVSGCHGPSVCCRDELHLRRLRSLPAP